MYIRITATLCAIGLLVATPLDAQDSTRSGETAAEARARMARRAAGLLVGPWELRGITPPNGVDVSTMPTITVYLRKGLDARLAMENGVGVWRRVQTTPPTGGLGGTPGEEVQSWVVAQTTNIRFFPATDAGATFEPWLLGGAGFTLGIDDRETSGGGILGDRPAARASASCPASRCRAASAPSGGSATRSRSTWAVATSGRASCRTSAVNARTRARSSRRASPTSSSIAS